MLKVQQEKIIWAYAPAVYNGSALSSKYVSMKGYNHLTIIVMTGAFAGARAITVNKATDVSAGDAEAHKFVWQWTDVAVNGTLVKTAVTASTFDTSVANSVHVIEIDAADLLNDKTTGLAETKLYDCVSLEINNVAANDAFGVLYILSEPRYGTSVSALVD